MTQQAAEFAPGRRAAVTGAVVVLSLSLIQGILGAQLFATGLSDGDSSGDLSREMTAVFGAVWMLIGLLGVMAGFGVMSRKRWWWLLAIVIAAALGVLRFPIGSILWGGAVVLLFLGRAYVFTRPAAAAVSAVNEGSQQG
jgi:hypothetical protein